MREPMRDSNEICRTNLTLAYRSFLYELGSIRMSAMPMLKHDLSQFHIPLENMWTFRNEESQLSTEEKHHMSECDECISLLGLCHL